MTAIPGREEGEMQRFLDVSDHIYFFNLLLDPNLTYSSPVLKYYSLSAVGG